MRRIMFGVVGLVILLGLSAYGINAQVRSTKSNNNVKTQSTTLGRLASTNVALPANTEVPIDSTDTPSAGQLPDQSRGLPGVPAIPRKKTGVPAFTAQDARAWLKAQIIPFHDSTKGSFTIEKVEFLPNKAAETLLSTTTGLAPDAPVCIVTLRGSFVAKVPAGMTPTAATTQYEVFDAETGNLVLVTIAP